MGQGVSGATVGTPGRHAHRRRGVASLLAMLYLVVFAALALGFYATTNVASQLSANERRGVEAQYAVDSGIQLLRYHLNAVNIPGGLTSIQAFEELYTQLAARLEPTGNLNGLKLGYRASTATVPGEIRIPDRPTDVIALTPGGPGFRAVITDASPNISVKFTSSNRSATGAVGAARAVKLTFQRAPKPYALVGINSLTLSGNAYTDSYDASKGAYDPTKARAAGSIGSNGNIKLTDYVKINGDVRYGKTSTVTVASTVTVKGMAAPVTTPIAYPSVTLPPAGTYTDLGDVNMSGGTSTMGGGTYVINNLTLGGTAKITWTGPVKLYIKSSYNVSGGVVINTYQNLPFNRQLYFLPTCTTATWSGTNVCVGDLYAPDTSFVVSGSVEKLGRIIAKSIDNSSSGGMHYDESLPAPNGQISFAPVPNSYLEVAP
jgi:hypothetical protein